MAEPNEPPILSDEEIERRLAELEASIAAEAPKPPTTAAPGPSSPPAPDMAEAPLTSTEQMLDGLRSPIDERPQPEDAPRARAKTTVSASAVGQSIGSSPIVERAIGIARFAQAYYRDVMGDGGATLEAALIVVIVAIATGLGGLAAGATGFLAGLVWALIRWILFTVAAWFLAREVFKTRPEGDITALARVVGYAQAPGILAIVGFIPLLGWSLSLVGNIWLVLAVVMALRYVLKLDFKQAFLTAISSWLLAAAVAALIAVVIGVNLSTVF